jgi:hypothetical protein
MTYEPGQQVLVRGEIYCRGDDDQYWVEFGATSNDRVEVLADDVVGPAPTTPDEGAGDLLYMAWTIIANANGGDWEAAEAEWRHAAEHWRDDFHRWLDEHPAIPADVGSAPATPDEGAALDTGPLRVQLAEAEAGGGWNVELDYREARILLDAYTALAAAEAERDAIRQATADEIADDIEHEAPDLPFVWSPARAASHCAEIARRVGGGGGGGGR